MWKFTRKPSALTAIIRGGSSPIATEVRAEKWSGVNSWKNSGLIPAEIQHKGKLRGRCATPQIHSESKKGDSSYLYQIFTDLKKILSLVQSLGNLQWCRTTP